MPKLHRSTLSLILATAALMSSGPSLAHGDASAKYGGAVKEANEMMFELVATPAGAAVYITDHGKIYDASKMTGRITVDKDSDKAEADLKYSADNKLIAPGVKLPKGAKAVVIVKDNAGAVTTVRFIIK